MLFGYLVVWFSLICALCSLGLVLRAGWVYVGVGLIWWFVMYDWWLICLFEVNVDVVKWSVVYGGLLLA